MVNEVHMAQRTLPVRDILDRMRHDGCGDRESLLRRIEGACRRREDDKGLSIIMRWRLSRQQANA